jgi:hypothetical protein
MGVVITYYNTRIWPADQTQGSTFLPAPGPALEERRVARGAASYAARSTLLRGPSYGVTPSCRNWLRASLELDGGEHTRGRVAALSVAEDLEVLEDRGC